jgi:hypothetical protein
MIVGPSGSSIDIDTIILADVPILYIAGDLYSNKTLVVDSSYTLTVVFNVSSISIDNVIYPIGSIVKLGPLVYKVIAFGSVLLERVYNFVAPVSISTTMYINYNTLRSIRFATIQPDSTTIGDFRGGREMARNAITSGRSQRYPDYASYLKYIKGKEYVKIQNNIKK